MKRLFPLIIFLLSVFFVVSPLTGQDLPEDLKAAAEIAEIEAGLATANAEMLAEYKTALGDMGLSADPLFEERIADLRKKVVRAIGVSNLLSKGFVLVEAGSFSMGSPSGDPDRFSNEILHTVKITKSFYISKYEVTQGEYSSVIGFNPSYSKGGIGANNPVNNVSWYDAVKFCNELSLREDLEQVYIIDGNKVTCDFSKNGYRLPTEAEWEYAARGGHMGRGSNTYAGSNSIGSVAWYSGNSGWRTHPVGGKQANELGLYDMSGNMWEWCWDWYGNYPRGSVTDPTGPPSGKERIRRGGWWGYDAWSCRSAYRDTLEPSSGDGGLRLVRIP